MNQVELQQILAKLNKAKVQVLLPKFHFTSRMELALVLGDLGMPLAFTGGADFSGITPGGLLIDNVIHAGCVEVDEVGTVAAAATLVIIYESERPLFRVDHPFLFLIRDTQTGDLCFIGRCVNPIVD